MLILGTEKEEYVYNNTGLVPYQYEYQHGEVHISTRDSEYTDMNFSMLIQVLIWNKSCIVVFMIYHPNRWRC